MPADREYPGGDADVEAAFAQIVAGWDDEAADPVPRWPASEDLSDTSAAAAVETVDPRDQADERGGAGLRDIPPSSMEQIRFVRDHGLPTPEQEPAGPPSGPRDWELASIGEEHFQPPEPPPLPRGDLGTQLAWAAVLLGPAFLVFAGLFWRDVSRLWLGLATAAFVGGFVALVMRLPQSRDDSDDDGAVV